MATRLIQIVAFANVGPGATVALPHQINVNEVPEAPDFVAPDEPGFTIVVTATQVSVTNNNVAPTSVNVWLELKHTIPRQLGAVQTISLVPRPFIVSGGGAGGGGGGGGDTPASVTTLMDFYGDTAALASYFNRSGSGFADMTNAQTLVGPSGGPWPCIGACILSGSEAGDDANFDMRLPSSQDVSDSQLSTIAEVDFEVAAKVNDDQTTPGQTTDVQFFGTQLGFECSNNKFGNNHWWAMGDPAFPGGFDTGVAVETLRMHVYRVEQNPNTPLVTWLIDGVAVHTMTSAPDFTWGAFSPFLDVNVDTPLGANDVIIDYIAWTIKTPQRMA